MEKQFSLMGDQGALQDMPNLTKSGGPLKVVVSSRFSFKPTPQIKPSRKQRGVMIFHTSICSWFLLYYYCVWDHGLGVILVDLTGLLFMTSDYLAGIFLVGPQTFLGGPDLKKVRRGPPKNRNNKNINSVLWDFFGVPCRLLCRSGPAQFCCEAELKKSEVKVCRSPPPHIYIYIYTYVYIYIYML